MLALHLVCVAHGFWTVLLSFISSKKYESQMQVDTKDPMTVKSVFPRVTLPQALTIYSPEPTQSVLPYLDFILLCFLFLQYVSTKARTLTGIRVPFLPTGLFYWITCCCLITHLEYFLPPRPDSQAKHYSLQKSAKLLKLSKLPRVSFINFLCSASGKIVNVSTAFPAE